MDKKHTDAFKKQLIKMRGIVEKQLRGLKEGNIGSTIKDNSGDLSNYSFHMADMASDQWEREFSLQLADDSGNFLYEINEALYRIEKKKYGICEDCGKPIPLSRLKVKPNARYCVKCKSAHKL